MSKEKTEKEGAVVKAVASLPVALAERAERLIAILGSGKPLKRAMAESDLSMGQYQQIYENLEWAGRIDKACTAFKRYAKHAVLQETVSRYVEGDTEQVITKEGDLVERKVQLNAGIFKTLMSGLDGDFAVNPALAGGGTGGPMIQIINQFPAATVANISMGNEDVVQGALRKADAREGVYAKGGAVKVVDAEVIE